MTRLFEYAKLIISLSNAIDRKKQKVSCFLTTGDFFKTIMLVQTIFPVRLLTYPAVLSTHPIFRQQQAVPAEPR